MNSKNYEVILDSLIKKFGEETAVDRLSLEFERGLYFFLLGPSGCGKTTTLRMIGGLEEPTSGTIWIGGENMAMVPAHRRKTAMVFQNFALFPHMTVLGNLEFGLKARKISKKDRREKLNRIMEMLEITSLASLKPDKLSIGEIQRVALGRALILEPSVLLLDEPLGAMELSLRERIQVELKNIQRNLNITFIHVTHDKEEAMLTADKIVLMNHGRIEQIDSPQMMYRKPLTTFAARFFQSGNLIDADVVNVSGKIVKVRNALGEFLIETDRETPAMGSKVRFLTFYDRMSLKGGDEFRNCVVGVVRGKQIIGTLIIYSLELENGLKFKFTRHISASLGNLEANQRLALYWRPKDAILFA